MTHFLLDIANTPVGTTVDVGVIRQGQTKTLKAKIAEYPEGTPQAPSSVGKTTYGIIVQEVPDEMAKSLQLKFNQKGVVVTGLDPSTPIGQSQIALGDIILSINQKPITSVQSFYDQLATTRPGDTVLLYALRNNISAYFTFIK